MQFVATLAVIVSVLVLAIQTREVARQARVANEVAGTQAHREIIFWDMKRTDVFTERPELHAYYYDRTTETPSAADAVRLEVIAEQHASWLESALLTTQKLQSYSYGATIGEWSEYIGHEIEASTALRSIIRKSPGVWPPLEPFVSQYDDKQAASAQPTVLDTD
jgi:hypothetical protein